MLLRIHGEGAPEVGREAIWSEKQSVMRRMIRERDYQRAYDLAAGHGLSPGEAFRDAEWTAGWIALSKLNDPVKAEAHFRTFAAGVNTPISVSRAQYWLGEALTAQKKANEAQAAYEAAAKYPYVFYGQLAAEKVKGRLPEAARIAFELPTAPTDEHRAAFAKTPMVRVAILLAETGRLASFERFSYAIDDTLATAMEHQMLFDIGAGYLEMRSAVRGAKAGLGRGLVAPDAVFPMHGAAEVAAVGIGGAGAGAGAVAAGERVQPSRHFIGRCARTDADGAALCAGGSADGGPALPLELADGRSTIQPAAGTRLSRRSRRRLQRLVHPRSGGLQRRPEPGASVDRGLRRSAQQQRRCGGMDRKRAVFGDTQLHPARAGEHAGLSASAHRASRWRSRCRKTWSADGPTRRAAFARSPSRTSLHRHCRR